MMAMEKMQDHESRGFVRSQASEVARMKLKGGKKMDAEF